MKQHKITWLNVPGYIPQTWNPAVGCTKISEGCVNCYAERMATCYLSNIEAKQCALIAVDEILKVIPMYTGNLNPKWKFWDEVRTIITTANITNQ